MKALDLIHAERNRQIHDKGWTPEHDDEHTDGELACAAAAFALSSTCRNFDEEIITAWPWGEPMQSGSPERDLIRAGALIVAEIERIERQTASSLGQTPHIDETNTLSKAVVMRALAHVGLGAKLVNECLRELGYTLAPFPTVPNE